MADSDSESEIPSDVLSRRNISSSIFSIPGYIVGLGAKGLSDFDSIRSPTSPLDIGVFSNFRKPASLRFARSSSEKGYKKELNCNRLVGLGIVNSLVDDTESEVLGAPKKNIIFGPQVRPNAADFLRSYHGSIDSSLRSKSLPTNYVASRLSQNKCLKPQSSSKDLAFDNEEVPSENAPLCFPDFNVPSSLASLTYNHSLRSENFLSEVKPIKSSPLVIGTSIEVENSLETKPSTVQIPIGPGQGFVGSLSAREIELSEDYTCIISHGPNPKTIHIFGDCVLECHATDLNNFDNKEESGNGSPKLAKSSERSSPVQPIEVLTFCYTCKRKLEEGQEVYMYRGEKAFCGFDCCSGDISEEETETAYQKSSVSSRGSSFQEDLFLLGMPVAM